MQLLVLFCLVAGSLAQIDFNIRDCPANSHFTSCGTACPLTCDNYQNPPKICVLMCKIGCECDEGYVKAKDGSCVLPENCPAQAVEKSCSSEPESGLCNAYFPSWYYDTTSGTCKEFVYGGCGGNGNRYETEQECLQTCAAKSAFNKVCPDNSHFTSCGTACPLTCDNYQNPPKACVLMCKIGCQCDEGYVKAKDGSCVLPEDCPAQGVVDSAFSKVCPDNSHFTSCGTACPLTCDNYLNPPKACVLMCKIGCQCDDGYVKAKDGSCVLPEQCSAQDSEVTLDVCNLPAETGVCRGLFRRYAYDRTTGECKRFVYGGCGGNENNFETLEECERACPVQRALDRPDCDKKAEPGNCLAYIPRYYYDQEEGMCKKFVYGGCGGNRNNFATEFECYNKCGALAAPKEELCEQEKETGLCRAYIPQYYYNKVTGECEKFIYGGCGGNDNRFSSKDNCEQVCKA